MVSAHLENQGLHVDIIPHQYTAEALASIIPRTRKPAKILFPKGNCSPNILEPLLKKKGHSVDSIEVYRVTQHDDLYPQLQQKIDDQDVDCIACRHRPT
ncbi:hypothetical protein MARGE09_P3043 [Marinagarivorans cellulosilyticus]|uniref:Tetrapyrrole biosynthesis uroporphyrinogen III synthase domain-containing protein n=2 Tax=Marinagarivorans cellulosilyticus TaxID=2721545 RepID=A0AAN1WJQ6_9GAMM|nr:hypothetical protein MARGE09_P3043 [Marinagarivorans cellulosilyticus]